jgi:hypothetical protein
VGDTNTAKIDSRKVLDPKPPIREADIKWGPASSVANDPLANILAITLSPAETIAASWNFYAVRDWMPCPAVVAVCIDAKRLSLAIKFERTRSRQWQVGRLVLFVRVGRYS